jgi:hypothetical protein
MPYQDQLYRRMKPVPDFVFLGSSRTAWAVDPARMDLILSLARARPVHSFNFGLGAGNALAYRLAVDRLLRRSDRPSTVVIGLSPRDVTDWSAEQLADDMMVGVTPGRLWSLWDEFTAPALRENLLLSSLIPGRSRWEAWQGHWIALRDGHHSRPSSVHVHANGWTQFTDYARDKRRNKLQRDRSSLRRLRAEPLSPTACRSFENALLRLRDTGIKTIVYEHPVPPSLLADHRSGTYEKYRRWLELTAQATGAILLTDVFVEAVDDDFIDGLHVAPWAVEKYSEHLASKVASALSLTGVRSAHGPKRRSVLVKGAAATLKRDLR